MENKFQKALKKAHAEIEKANINDPELKKVAFSRAIEFYLHNELLPSQGLQQTDHSVQKTPSSFWSTLEDITGIETKKLKDIYSIDGDQVRLVMMLPKPESHKKAEKQRELATLVLFAYHEGLKWEWVPSTYLAESAKHSGLYDTSKFAKNLKMEWFRQKGKRRGLKYKLSSIGTKHAKELLLNNPVAP